MSEATPRPWVFDGSSEIDGPGFASVAALYVQATAQEAEENGRLIVKAVNSFEPMVEALQIVKRCKFQCCPECHELIEAALKLAGEK